MFFRRPSTRLFVALIGGCAALIGGCADPPPPSTPAERAINPETITRDNPAGDALSPTDAALERLLHEKLGRKIDKLETIEPAFPDAKNWKRIRFFGYPTRGGFRYGKDPSYAAAVLYYWEAEDDAPTSCIEQFATKARRIADVFDLDVGPMERQMRDHRRGVEAVAWDAWEAEWADEERARIAKLEERLDKSEARRAAMRKRVAQGRFARALRFRGLAAKETAAEAPKPGAKADEAAPTGREGATAPPPTPEAPKETGAAEATDDLSPEEAEALAKRKARIEQLRKRIAEARRRRAERLANMTPEDKEALEERRRQARERREKNRQRRKARLEKMLQPRPAPIPKAADLGPGDMPVITTSGAFTTLFNRDRYLGAMAAYDSWPGTCLVQGFAVKVGSDEELARRVLDRWLDEVAPILRWHRDLRERPPIKNR